MNREHLLAVTLGAQMLKTTLIGSRFKRYSQHTLNGGVIVRSGV